MPKRYRDIKKSSFKKRRRTMRKKRVGRWKPKPILSGFPKSMLVKLRYCETFTMNPAAGSLVVQLFRANSLFDPNFTGIGHQPSNYDRLSLNYDRYTVLGSKIRICETNVTATSVTQGLLAVHLSEDGTDITTAHGSGGVDNVLEQPRLNRCIRTMGITNIGAPFSVVKKFSARKFFGVSTATLKAEPYSSDIASNPSEAAFFEVAYISPDDTNDPGIITVRAEIEYVAILSEPKLADAS